jgi:hypothetical protein
MIRRRVGRLQLSVEGVLSNEPVGGRARLVALSEVESAPASPVLRHSNLDRAFTRDTDRRPLSVRLLVSHATARHTNERALGVRSLPSFIGSASARG